MTEAQGEQVITLLNNVSNHGYAHGLQLAAIQHLLWIAVYLLIAVLFCQIARGFVR